MTTSFFDWAGEMLPMNDADKNLGIDLSAVEPKKPVNLRLCTFPYLHLRDDEGCVLARDFMDIEKMSYLLLTAKP